jgi:pimeloyl-ACP methyl ester carboxylesterase
VPHKYFSVDGVATFVHHQGPTTLPDVPPHLAQGEAVLCLHGSGGNGNVFRGLSRALSERHSPLAFDMPGHARSGSLDSLGSVERMAEFTIAFGEKLALRSPRVLLGHSLGGAVATEVALLAPDAVRALVILSTPIGFPDPDPLPGQVRLVTEGKQRRNFDRGAYAKETPNEIVFRGFGEDAKTDPRVLYGDLLAMRSWRAVADLEQLADIQAPTLVLYGEHEGASQIEGCEKLASVIPNARAQAIANSGHMIPLEQPAALADAVAMFLGELS